MRKIEILLFLIAITSVYFLVPINVVFASNKSLSLGSVMSAQELSDGSLLITDGGGVDRSLNGGQVIIIDEKDNIIWRYNDNLAFPHSSRLFSDGSIVISDSVNNRVISVDRETKKLVWSSDQWTSGSGKLSDGTRLGYPNNVEEVPGGNMLITDRDNNRIIFVDRNGNVIFSFEGIKGPHNGHYLGGKKIIFASAPGNRVAQYDAQTNAIREFVNLELNEPKDVEPLTNGNTLITDSNNNRVIEVDGNNKIVWEYKGGLYGPQSAIRLKNGDTLIVDSFNFRLMEVSPEKKVVREISPVASIPESDRLQNGSFEDMSIWSDTSSIARYYKGEKLSNNLLSDNRIFSHWIPGTLYSGGKGKISADTEIKMSGKQSARIDFGGDGTLFLVQPIKVVGGANYIFSGWIKTDTVITDAKKKNSLVEGARFELYWIDSKGHDIDMQTIFSREVSGQTDWKKTEFPVKTPERAVGVRIHATLFSPGTAWFDDVQFQKLEVVPFWVRWDYLLLSLVGTIIVISLFKILFRRFK